MFTDGVTTANLPAEEIKKETKRCKSGLYKAVKSIVKSPLFVIDPAVENLEYKLANHSTKKFETTHARRRRRGVMKDFTDYRARWKNKRIQESTPMLSYRGLTLRQRQHCAWVGFVSTKFLKVCKLVTCGYQTTFALASHNVLAGVLLPF
jgi:hypothetical protein